MIRAWRRALGRWAVRRCEPTGTSPTADRLRLRVWDGQALVKGPRRLRLRGQADRHPGRPSPRRYDAGFYRDHLLGNVIPFWARFSVDREQGGFLTHLDRQGRLLSAGFKTSAMQARIVYAFSLAYLLDPRPEHLEHADHGARFLREHLWDPRFGGWLESVDRDGTPRELDKPIVSQAYAVTGLLAHHRAGGEAESLDRAAETLRLLDERAWDCNHGGYLNRCRRDWTLQSERKSASVHNDITVALAAASVSAPDSGYERRLSELGDLLARRLSIGSPPRIGATFRRDWTYSPAPTSDVIDIGQSLKSAATLAEASQIIGREDLLAHARRLADFCEQNAWDRRHGGFLTYLYRGGRPASEEKLWWTQCEGIVALAALGSLTGAERYRALLDRLTGFCVEHFIDEGGEWYTSCEPDGQVRDSRKGGTWKGPYHSARAGFYGWQYLSAPPE